ncbi:hypothetical protein NT6N_35630 [Oceaniferula spumae]|uniref:Protein-export membrane protein SecG n=1 Tax=Oceaniferula spumae TaxID=2979115 RepID=A0AAT9FRB2_9BACT
MREKSGKTRKSRLYKAESLHHIPAPMTPVIAANWLNISINLLLVIHVIICLLLALVVLMQRPKQEGLGAAFGSGLTDQAFGARTTDVLQKGTVYLGTLFFVITLVLAILIGKRQNITHDMKDDSTDKTEEVSPVEVPQPLENDAPVEMPETDDAAPAGEAPSEGTTPTPPVTPPAAPPESTPAPPAVDQPDAGSEQ